MFTVSVCIRAILGHVQCLQIRFGFFVVSEKEECPNIPFISQSQATGNCGKNYSKSSPYHLPPPLLLFRLRSTERGNLKDAKMILVTSVEKCVPTPEARLFNVLRTSLKREGSRHVLHPKKQSKGTTPIWNLRNHLKLWTQTATS